MSDGLAESPQIQFDTSLELKEIIDQPTITKVSGMPDFVAGVIHHEGRKIPVVDLNLNWEPLVGRRRPAFCWCKYTRRKWVYWQTKSS